MKKYGENKKNLEIKNLMNFFRDKYLKVLIRPL